MKERPILFSGPMVRAILDGRKTMTRRVVKPQPVSIPEAKVAQARWISQNRVCPHGQPGDRLWVREAFFCDTDQDQSRCIYRADEVSAVIAEPHCWKPSIFMPRWASRITLEITDVRVERLQDVTEVDAKAEGMEFHDGRGIGHSGWRHDRDHGYVYIDARTAFRRCWDSLNAKRGYGWDANPWVWVISFKQHKEDR